VLRDAHNNGLGNVILGQFAVIVKEVRNPGIGLRYIPRRI